MPKPRPPVRSARRAAFVPFDVFKDQLKASVLPGEERPKFVEDRPGRDRSVTRLKSVQVACMRRLVVILAAMVKNTFTVKNFLAA